MFWPVWRSLQLWRRLALCLAVGVAVSTAAYGQSLTNQCPLPNPLKNGQCDARNWVPTAALSWTHSWDTGHGLPMGWQALNWVSQLDYGASLPPDGLYIFVFRTDGKLLVRRSDRPDDKGYFDCGNLDFLFPGNPPGDRSLQHMFVRHTQLNGGYAPVWSAGQMEIHSRSILWISNASGHFAPSIGTLDFVETALVDWGFARSGQIAKHDNRWQPSPTVCPGAAIPIGSRALRWPVETIAGIAIGGRQISRLNSRIDQLDANSKATDAKA